jgi:hypothetical protein
MPGAPFTSWLTLFLLSVLVLMAFDYPGGTYHRFHSADCGTAGGRLVWRA